MRKLTELEIEQALKTLDGWALKEGKLCSEFVFEDFKSAFAAMTEIALHAEEIQHHPEWCNVYNKLEIRLFTHDIQSLSMLDLQLATIINAMGRNYKVKRIVPETVNAPLLPSS
ncbi:4a-hydroxytetrahydrobiopterin dehydratase [Lishizhenia tianjinensis]|uniref:Putative pterin-4-alpha-carbinolamine dehydratase n=1 Tax=Lishizhenia tianjinensis TaxID=477690 RepID=A0A1I7AX15_9FLAO|nr:4a-hydroxytetrahydrobiopterin dehydratase [Lishizhenia tianjinensis]SFT79454.1 4a-hydroxytetrahydrobiopterin dehydratase [Lishizhenia tianjinensis]